MPNRTLLPETRIREALSDLPGWEFRENRLRKEFKFRDFVTAWSFMSGCAIHAQVMDHHPNWCNIYDTVMVELSTHDAGGVTGIDLELARRFEEMARHIPPEAV